MTLPLLCYMRCNVYLHHHRFLAQLGYPKQRPNRLMVRHPLAHIPHHRGRGLVREIHVVGSHPEDLVPAFSAGVLSGSYRRWQMLGRFGLRWNG